MVVLLSSSYPVAALGIAISIAAACGKGKNEPSHNKPAQGEQAATRNAPAKNAPVQNSEPRALSAEEDETLRHLQAAADAACACATAACALPHIDLATDLAFPFPNHRFPEGPLHGPSATLNACAGALIAEQKESQRAPQGEGVEICGQRLKPSATVLGCDLSSFDNLDKLKLLPELDNVALQGFGESADLRPLASSSKLRFLILDNVHSGSLEVLGTISTLERVTIIGGDVADLSPITSNKKLQRLTLWGTPVSSLAPLEELDALEVLTLNKHSVSASSLEAFARARPDVALRLW